MTISVRRTHDISLIKRLHKKIFPEDINESDDTQAHWVISCGDKPIGFCSAKLVDGNTVYYTRAGIIEGYRGKGLQKRLIRVRMNWAKSVGADAIITYTLIRNYPSIVNLIRSGFHFYNPQTQWVGPNVHYFRMLL